MNKKSVAIALAALTVTGFAAAAEPGSSTQTNQILGQGMSYDVPSGYKLVSHISEKNKDVYSYEKKVDNLNYDRYQVAGYQGKTAEYLTGKSPVAAAKKLEKSCSGEFSTYQQSAEAQSGVLVAKCGEVVDVYGVKRSLLVAQNTYDVAGKHYQVKWFKYSEPSSDVLSQSEIDKATSMLTDVKPAV